MYYFILQRNDEEAVVDTGGTRSLLKTHFEKEDLEGENLRFLIHRLMSFKSINLIHVQKVYEVTCVVGLLVKIIFPLSKPQALFLHVCIYILNELCTDSSHWMGA